MPKPKKKRIRLSNSDVSYEHLVELEASGGRPVTPPAVVPSSIEVADRVFQPRLPEEDPLASELHIEGLMEALERGDTLPPLLVLSVGKRLFVVDGHHRLAAYHGLSWKKPVDVEVFEGTLDEALIEAIKRNSHTKLPMGQESRAESAWRLVRTVGYALTRDEVATITGVAPRTVSTMRRVLREHREEVIDLPWTRARTKQWADQQQVDEDWRDQEVQKIAKRLLETGLLKELLKRPDIFADALGHASPEFPEVFCSQYIDVARALVEEYSSLDI